MGHPFRGFTLIEFAVALALFTLSAVTIGAMTTGVLASRQKLSALSGFEQTLTNLVEVVATEPFDVLTAGTFTVPQRCPDDPVEVGADARSCVMVDGETVMVDWVVTVGADRFNTAGGPVGAADFVEITAVGVSPAGHRVERGRRLPAPWPGFHGGTAVAQVRLAGEVSTLTGPVLLLAGPAFDVVVAAGIPDPVGTVQLRGPVDACSVASPCRIGLQPGPGRGVSATHGLDRGLVDAADTLVVFDETAPVTVTGSVHQLSQHVIEVSAVTPEQLVPGAAGRPSSAVPAVGSVCVWLSFTDRGPVETAVCNTGGDGRFIPLSSYPIDPGDPHVRAVLPAGTAVTVRSEAVDGSCPLVAEQHMFTGGGWEPLPPTGGCTSWTWGAPDVFDDPSVGSVLFEGAAFSVQPHGRSTIVFDGSRLASGVFTAAAGSGSGVGFTQPRAGSVPVLPAGFPTETGACVESGCWSPQPGPARITGLVRESGPVTGPVGWPYAVVAAEPVTQFRVEHGTGHPASPAYPVVVTPPPVGVLSVCPPVGPCTPLSGPTPVSGDSPIGFEYERPPELTGAEMLVDLGGTVEVVPLVSAVRPHHIAVTVPSLTQGDPAAVSPIQVTVTGTDGAPSVGAQVFVTGPAGSTAPVWSATTGADGSATVWVSGGTAPAGGAVVEVMVPGVGTVTADTQIVAVPAMVVVAGDDQISQGMNGQLTVTVTDWAGGPLPHWPVTAAVTQFGRPAVGVWVPQRTCFTDSAGSCELTVTVDAGAPVEPWAVTARAGAAVSPVWAGVVTQETHRVLVEGAAVPQTQSGSVRFRLIDGAGQPVAGETAAVTAPAGVTVTHVEPTGLDGSGFVTVTVGADSPAGTHPIGVSHGGAVGTGSFTVTGIAYSVHTPPAVVTLNPSEDRQSVTVTVLDRNGDPVSGAVTEFGVLGSGVRVTPAAVTGTDGTVTVWVVRDPGAGGGSGQVAVTVRGSTVFDEFEVLAL